MPRRRLSAAVALMGDLPAWPATRLSASGHAERAARFVQVAEDPPWCSQRVALHIARRMSESLI